MSVRNTLLPLPLLFLCYDFFYSLFHRALHHQRRVLRPVLRAHATAHASRGDGAPMAPRATGSARLYLPRAFWL
jgi:hypothetical protein